MHQIAIETDFLSLPDHYQEGYLEMMRVAREYGITVRCEKAGRSFVLIASEGLSGASYFIKRFERAIGQEEFDPPQFEEVTA